MEFDLINFTVPMILVLGIVFTLFGYRIHKIFISIMGFVTMFNVASLLSVLNLNPTMFMILRLAVGCLGLLFALNMEKFAISLIIFYCFYMSMGTMLFSSMNTLLTWLVLLLIFVVINLVTNNFFKYFIIFVSTIIGSYYLINFIGNYFNIPNILTIILMIIFIIIGFIFQKNTTKSVE